MSKINALIAIVAILVSGSAQAGGDPSKGKRVFNKCRACHALVAGKKKIGPSLFGVFGRKAGSAEKYNYSPALKNAAIVWDEQTLSTYLTDPKKFIPGNRMPFAGLKNKADRDDLIAYLKTATH